ncbi:MAG: beta-ketoacyl-[acyl-carrier-protein] synthase family protein [Phycisphaerales bacterium JB043]
MSRDVAITGVGVVSAYGAGLDALWEGLCEGVTCIAPVESFDATGFACSLAAEVPSDFSARGFVPKSYRKAVKVMARDIEYAVAAAQEAACDAALVTRESEDQEPTYPLTRLGCQIGAGLIACEMPEIALAMSNASDDDGSVDIRVWGERGMQNLTPLWLLKYLPNMLACHVTIIHGARGPSNTITCSEASGLLSVGEASSVIRRGRADACFAGSAEAKINAMGLVRMQLAERLATCDADATDVVRPYSPAASGSVLGDGGGLVILEDAHKARDRGARLYARVAGFGASHSSSSEPGHNARSLTDALEIALEDAGVNAGDVDAIVPLALGVGEIDSFERSAFESAFGDRLSGIPIVVLSPMIGYLCAGVGGVSLGVAAKCLLEQKLPAGVATGLGTSDLSVSDASQSASLDTIVVCNSSHGGQHAAVVLRRV